MPQLSQDKAKLITSNLAVKFTGSIRQKPINFLGKGSVGVPNDCPNFKFWVPPIISGRGKATNFKFCTHIHSNNRKPLKNSGKVAVYSSNRHNGLLPAPTCYRLCCGLVVDLLRGNWCNGLFWPLRRYFSVSHM